MLRQNLNVTQRQQLTIQPSMLQLVRFLTLTQLELKDVINEEMIANPALEELDPNLPLPEEAEELEPRPDHAAERIAAASSEAPAAPAEERKDPFDEIDFPSWEEYLDPGYRSQQEMETIERPSFENFLSRPETLTDHLMWQLGALSLSNEVRAAAEEIIGNLNEEGYLTASDDEMLELVAAPVADEPIAKKAGPPPDAMALEVDVESADPVGSAFTDELAGEFGDESQITTAEIPLRDLAQEHSFRIPAAASSTSYSTSQFTSIPTSASASSSASVIASMASQNMGTAGAPAGGTAARLMRTPRFSREALQEALQVVRRMDPAGVGSRTLRECILAQLHYLQTLLKPTVGEEQPPMAQLLADAIGAADQHIEALGKKHYKEIAKAMGRPVEAVQAAEEFIGKLDPRPGLRYNRVETRVIEPDVFLVKHGDEYLVLMNEDDLPQLRVNPQYRRLMERGAEKETRNYVKEKYKSALQLIKNIEQRRQTIQKVCYCILARQQEFLDHGLDHLKPMMIKDVAEEIGVHASTVSRAVSNKYAHTPQGVFELRYFFSEGVGGEKGGDTSLINVKRRVKKLIAEEDSAQPLTDEQITDVLSSEGIQVTRRTVAKYREDMRIPSTHQRRKKA